MSKFTSIAELELHIAKLQQQLINLKQKQITVFIDDIAYSGYLNGNVIEFDGISDNIILDNNRIKYITWKDMHYTFYNNSMEIDGKLYNHMYELEKIGLDILRMSAYTVEHARHITDKHIIHYTYHDCIMKKVQIYQNISNDKKNPIIGHLLEDRSENIIEFSEDIYPTIRYFNTIWQFDKILDKYVPIKDLNRLINNKLYLYLPQISS